MPAATDFAETTLRRPVAALLTGTLWLAAIAGLAVIATRLLPVRSLAPLDIAELAATLVLQVAAPVAVVLVALELVRRGGRDDVALAELEGRHREAAAATTAIRDGLLDIDATLVAVAGRLDTLRATAAADGTGLVDAAVRLETAAAGLAAAGTSTGASAQALLDTIPALQRQADAVGTTLAATGGETARQLGEIETMLAGVWARNLDAREQVATASAAMAGLLAGIEAASVSAAAAIAERTGALSAAVDTALDRTGAALGATRDSVGVQTSSLLASVDQARTALDKIGGEASQAIARRLERVLAAADQLGQRLAEQDAQSKAMVGTVERSFAVLDARLGHAATMSHSTLDGIATRMTALRGEVDTIGAPLATTNAALHEAEATSKRLAGEAASLVTTLGTTLPGHRETLAGLTSDVAALAREALAVAQPVADSRDAARHLGEHLADARVTLGAIENQSQGSALAASNQLIEVLARVREVANATAGTMRDTLAGIVAEAEAALAEAGSRQADAAFGTPIRAELAGLEDAGARAGAAAQAAAKRIAQRLLGLTRTIATVEARVAEIDTGLDQRLRHDIATRSTILIDSLRASAIELAKPLASDVGDSDWKSYLKGDRSLFARKAVRLVDGGTARAIANHSRDDPAFAEQAARYIDEFEALLKRASPGGEAGALAVTLVSSDIGKLYVVLAQALGRHYGLF